MKQARAAETLFAHCQPTWLVVRLPRLALDCHTRGQGRRSSPIAITETVRARETVIDCNASATAAGVQRGMPVPAACAIVPELQAVTRDLAAEEAAMQRIAAWCYQYSHQVHLPAGRSGLALEVGASERLFGKPEPLARRIEHELARIGYRAVTGSAPTPEAAWLAAHDSLYLAPGTNLRQALGGLPLGYLHLQKGGLEAMESMGLGRLRDLLRLPRKSLARRFGPELPAYLDRLLGICPDPCPLYQPPEAYTVNLELPAEIALTQGLLFPLKRLLDELCGVLRGADAAVQEVRITLGHEDSSDSLLRLGLQSPSQDPERLLSVLRERLERLKLPGAVRSIRLEAPQLLRFAPGQQRLFGDDASEQAEGVGQLAERLQARLGEEAVRGIAGVEDHRPEYSWRTRSLGETATCTPLPHRPAWLLPRPRRCDIQAYEILSGPERIESGWWDGRDCRRDYFIVRDASGCRLWVFREYKPRNGWFVHGIFS